LWRLRKFHPVEPKPCGFHRMSTQVSEGWVGSMPML